MSVPSRLGRYPVRRRLGAGAFATVWLAYDEHLDSPVAVKVLADNWSGDEHVRVRFVEEGRYLRKVESPHVVNVYDAGELDDGRPYLVMSYADQGTLADRLALAPLSTAQGVHVISQLGDGLASLHDQSVLHRDVKPANVLFRTQRTGRVVVMLGDLGLGKAMDVSSRLTMVGGTPSYVAPEQARGDHLDARADQYSLAALTYLVLTGRPAYTHATLTAAAEPCAPESMTDAVSEEVEAVVLRGLSPDREDRFEDVRAFVEALTQAYGGGDPTVLSDAAPEAWIPLDPELTVASGPPPLSRPFSPLPDPVEPPTAPSRPSLARVLVAVLAVALGIVGGVVAERSMTRQVGVTDASGSISVQVPRQWANDVDGEGWQPPDEDAEFPALGVGANGEWNGSESPAPGVFAALMPGDDLPARLPQHPECDASRPPLSSGGSGTEAMTVVFTGCPGADVTVERVQQVATNRLLWVQVRSDDEATANRVLDEVRVHGLGS
ncbi:MAG: serine/threonine-protein kinase [Nocardioides sp.]|uniref:serine/threonine-protein kinase n=1 Tax=Nocardioides sp. TaxID=35761 RepID=UPI003F01B7E1